MFLVFLKEIQLKWFLQSFISFILSPHREYLTACLQQFFPFEDKGRLYEAITKTFYKFYLFDTTCYYDNQV